MKILSLFVFLLSGLLALGQQKQVCFSFDDLPVVSYGITDTIYQKKLINKLVRSLCDNKIPAIGFVNESYLYENEVIDRLHVELIKDWIWVIIPFLILITIQLLLRIILRIF